MKKWLTGFFIVIILLFVSVYFFIPDQLTVSKIDIIKANRNGVFRVLSDKSKWQQWWPDKNIGANESNGFYYNNFHYNLDNILYNGVQVLIENGSTGNISFINIIPIHIDSVALEWKCELTTGLNPLKKIMQYEKAKAIRNNMIDIFDHLRLFLEQSENIYGFNIQHTTLKDTVLVATKTLTKNYPSTKIIYSVVQNLKAYIKSEGAKEVDYPMLNITKKDSSGYELMVGIPTDRLLEGTSTIFYRRLSPIPDKILTTEVKGGPAAVHRAYEAIANYMTDHQLSAPVIPFEYLVTDRSKERDTAKWITKIFYPII